MDEATTEQPAASKRKKGPAAQKPATPKATTEPDTQEPATPKATTEPDTEEPATPQATTEPAKQQPAEREATPPAKEEPAKRQATDNNLVAYWDFNTNRAYVNTAGGRFWHEGELWQAEPAKGDSSPVMARFGCEGHEAVRVVGVWWELFKSVASCGSKPPAFRTFGKKKKDEENHT
jgi:hypothetical protein